MKTGLKDVKKRELLIGDSIAMCSYTYSLDDWGKSGCEYCFSTGKEKKKKGRVQWNGSSQYDHKLYDENFLIIKRGKKLMAKVSAKWNSKGTDLT